MASVATAVFYLQLLLACWQILRLTPLALSLKAIALRLQTICAAVVGFKLKTGYGIPGYSYAGPFLKTTLRSEDYYREPTLASLRADAVYDLQVRQAYDAEKYDFEWHNYKCAFKLERQGSNMFLYAQIDKKASRYYITGHVLYWERVMHIFSNPMLVVVKKKQGFLGSTLTGEILSPEEILDEVLLRSCWLLSDRGWLLPVVAPDEETKLLASLNLVGLYGQVKQWSSLFISIWTLIVTLLQFSHRARQKLYRLLNKGAVALLRRLIDQLPVQHRRFMYSLGTFWEDLAPCNDCEARVLRRRDQMEFYSVSNVKCNDLTFKELIVPDSTDETEVYLHNELISGHISQQGPLCYIRWGRLSNRTGFRPNSPYRTMLKSMVKHQSGARLLQARCACQGLELGRHIQQPQYGSYCKSCHLGRQQCGCKIEAHNIICYCIFMPSNQTCVLS